MPYEFGSGKESKGIHFTSSLKACDPGLARSPDHNKGTVQFLDWHDDAGDQPRCDESPRTLSARGVSFAFVLGRTAPAVGLSRTHIAVTAIGLHNPHL